jgi:hypothetical protein
VNKTSYENCIDKNFIENITRGGRDVFNLTLAKPYYFLSGKGDFFKGMKVAVHVRDNAPPLGHQLNSGLQWFPIGYQLLDDPTYDARQQLFSSTSKFKLSFEKVTRLCLLRKARNILEF